MSELQTDLYSFNKANMSQISPMGKKWLNNKYREVAQEIMNNGQYWMLLCRERNYYTVFYFHEDINEATQALKETIENCGKVIDFTKQPDGNYEIWIRDYPEGKEEDNCAYYLFNYSFGLVEA